MLKELKNRHSPLLFKKKAISKKSLKQCLDAARWAPSCNNSQPWRFILIEGKKHIVKLSEAFPHGNQWAMNAPLVGFIVSQAKDDCITADNDDLEYFQYDCGMAMMSFIIQAEHENIKIHQMAGYDEKKLKKILHIPHDYRVIVAFAAGYEEKLKDYKGELNPRIIERIKTTKRVRKPISEVYSMNKF